MINYINFMICFTKRTKENMVTLLINSVSHGSCTLFFPFVWELIFFIMYNVFIKVKSSLLLIDQKFYDWNKFLQTFYWSSFSIYKKIYFLYELWSRFFLKNFQQILKNFKLSKCVRLLFIPFFYVCRLTSSFLLVTILILYVSHSLRFSRPVQNFFRDFWIFIS